jgi:hypothetical protein
MLPGDFGVTIDRSEERGGTLAYVDYTHPVFEVFSGPRSGDLSAARFFRYHGSEGVDRGTVLARFDDGGVALAQQVVGEGVVLAWASTMDDYWNDLPLQPVYLPLVHELMKHVSAYEEPRMWYTAGEVVNLAANGAVRELIAAAGEDQELVLQSPSGENLIWNTSDTERFVSLAEQGYYQVQQLDGRGSVPIAVNLDPAESDLTGIAADEIRAALVPESGGTARAGVDIELTPEDLERRQAAWWYLLAGVLVILVAETLISNRKAGALR